MNVLAFDVGSSSVKAAIVRRGRIAGRVARSSFATLYTGDRAEVSPDAVLHAVANAFAQLGPQARKVDVIAMAVMAPSWLAMDNKGRAITPVVTHQDRRSVNEARNLAASIGRSRLLKTTGNLPVPGGISSTTWAWFTRHEKRLMKRADLVGHLQTFLHRQFNGSRVIDPGNASYMGIYNTLTQRGWNESLCDAVGATEHQLPQLIESEGVAGMVSRAAGESFGLTHGTPMLVGCVDTSAVMLLADSKNSSMDGQMVNAVGSTDVLAVYTNRPRPHERLLTRAMGVGKHWLSVSTLAAAGSALSWAKDQLFTEMPLDRFFEVVGELAKDSRELAGNVSFDPYLAGERMAIEQRCGAIHGLTLATTRRQILAAIIESLARASADRLKLMRDNGAKISSKVIVTGGIRGELEKLLRRDWPGKWKFKNESEATLRGLAALAEGAG